MDLVALRKLAKEAATNVTFDALLQDFIGITHLGENFREDGSLEVNELALKAAFANLIEAVVRCLPVEVAVYSNGVDVLLIGSMVLAAMGNPGRMKQVFNAQEVHFTEVLKSAPNASNSLVADKWAAKRWRSSSFIKAGESKDQVQRAAGSNEAPLLVFCRIFFGAHKQECFFDGEASLRRHMLSMNRRQNRFDSVQNRFALDLEAVHRDIQHVLGIASCAKKKADDVGNFCEEEVKRPRLGSFMSSLGSTASTRINTPGSSDSRRSSTCSAGSSNSSYLA